MSIRKKPEEAVPVLLALLDKAKEHAVQGRRREDADNPDDDADPLVSKFEDIEEELHGLKNLFPRIKRWEKTLLDQFCVLEQELDDGIFMDLGMETEIQQKLDLIKDDIVQLKGLISTVDMGVTDRLRTMSLKQPKYLSTEDNDDEEVSKEWADLGIEDKIFESEAMPSLFASFHCVESSQVKMCLLCLPIFPENSVIKKKPLIYWWIGEGLVTKNKNKTAEEVGEEVFQELLNEGFIKPSPENKSPSVNSFIVHPWIRRMLIQVAEENTFITFSSQRTPCNGSRRAFLCKGNDPSHSMQTTAENLLTVFNLNEQYLGTRSEWLAKLKMVEVLQMGRWKSCATHHIEVENQELLNGLGSQKNLKYLSLRGISRIETLPPSIVNLISLKILDLRACHNLEKLPPGISALKNLTHLDVSECYLLESMPKGLEQLLALQVVKGFVIGKARKNSCKISDLARLENLRKLSIRVGKEGEAHQDLESLVNFSTLRILTIAWGVISSAPAVYSISLPPNLSKLDLRCAPLTEVPKWLWPSKLPNLEKLYITGGELNSLPPEESKVKFLRLKYLKNLRIDEKNLVAFFPLFLRLEKISCQDGDIILDRASRIG